MAQDDPAALRAALDQLANALQPATLVAQRLRQEALAAAEDAATIEDALKRAVTILKSFHGDTR